MTVVENVGSHAVDLTGGRQLGPGQTANVDLAQANEAALLASGQIVVTDPSPPPWQPVSQPPFEGIPQFATYTHYPANYMVLYQGGLYYALTTFDSGAAFNAGDWGVLGSDDTVSIPLAQKGAANGVATLDGSSKIPVGQLPAAASLVLDPTPVKTGAYNAVANDEVRVDISGGSVPTTLPTAPPDRTRIALKLVKVSGTPGSTSATLVCGGSDKFNVAGGSTSLTFTALFQGAIVQYHASDSLWVVQTTDTPLGVALGAAKLGTDGTVGGPSGSGLASSVASASSVPFNVKGFGAKGDGATDDTTAIQAALAAAVAAGGGTVYFPGGTYLYSSQLNFDSSTGVTLKGDGQPYVPGLVSAAASEAPCTVRYTAAGATAAISARSSKGMRLEGIRFDYNNAGFTGKLIDLSCLASGELTLGPSGRDCFFGGTGGGLYGARAGIAGASVLVDISDQGNALGAMRALFTTCLFDNAVVGLSANKAWESNVERCTFNSGLTGSWILNPGDSVNYTANLFLSPAAGPTGISYTSTSATYNSDSIVYTANRFNTVGFPTGGTAITFQGLRCILLGNVFLGGNTAFAWNMGVDTEGGGGKLTALGNVFDSWTAFAFNVTCTGAEPPILVLGNSYYNTPTKWPAAIAPYMLQSPQNLIASPDPTTTVTLNGTTGYVTVPSAAALQLAPPMTLTCLINQTALANAGLISFSDVGANRAFEFWLDAAGKLNFGYKMAGGGVAVASTGVITAGQWMHVAVKYLASNGTVRFLIDGKPAGSGTATEGTGPFPGALLLGTRGGGIQFFNGSLQYAALFNAALSDAALYAHAQSINYRKQVLSEASLVALWPLGEAAGTTATDVKGARNGTYTGGFTLAGAGSHARVLTAATV